MTEAMKRAQKKYYEKNRERLLDYGKDYYERNSEERKEYQRRYSLKNSEVIREKRLYQGCKDKIRAKKFQDYIKKLMENELWETE